MKITDKQLNFTEANEGYRKNAYKCSAGKTTIGIGFNIEAGISKYAARALLEAQLIQIRVRAYAKYKWFANLNSARQIAICDMIFQLGEGGFGKFKKTIAAIRKGDFAAAAKEALDSAWYKQTPKRALMVADIIRTGKLPK